MQPGPDVWDWSRADAVVEELAYRQVEVLARIYSPPEWAIRPLEDPADVPFELDALETYCGALATRYRGRIMAYQIWNEPNLTREWAGQPPHPEGYVTLLERCSRAIRAADPEAIIVTAGLSPTGTRDHTALPDVEYLWELYRRGLGAHFDVLGVHAPGFALPPEASLEEALALGYAEWARYRHVETLRAIMVANGDAAKQIAITEMGWTTDTRPGSIYAWFGVSEDTQAAYLERAYRYAAEHWRPWVGLVSVIYIAKSTWTEDNEEWWWSITLPAPEPIYATTRPAYVALANMEKISDNPAFCPSAPRS
ncbi:MAG: cellulase family glycosylhydrolase [Anaerolineae bacterium]|nr:cellulase family glycosylhydrolase [Anaerolineae bacterium]